MKTFKLIVDTREQNPLPIPGYLDEWLDPTSLPTTPQSQRVKIEVVRRGLEAADYVLEDDPGLLYTAEGTKGAAIVERKASIDELSDNVFSPVRRPALIRLLSRMRERWTHPCLLVEGGLSTLFRPSRKVPTGLVIDGLQRLSLEYSVPIQLIDGRGLTQRAHVGEWVVRYLLNATVRGGS